MSFRVKYSCKLLFIKGLMKTSKGFDISYDYFLIKKVKKIIKTL